MLTKFPVKTDRGEYRVTIKRSMGIVFNHAFVTKVYQERQHSLPIFRFKKIHREIDPIIDWRDDLVSLAETTVSIAESNLDWQYRSTTQNPKAIETFLNWDGDMTTKK